MPFGRLREPVSALSRAHVLVSPNGSAAAIAAAFPALPTFSLSRTLGEPVSIEAERPWSGGRGPVVAVAGIAEPTRFEAALTAAGWTVSRLLTFADHHRYGRRDLDHMAAAVRETGATGVVTTGKDAVRLRWMRPLPFACAAVPLDVDRARRRHFAVAVRSAARGAPVSGVTLRYRIEYGVVAAMRTIVGILPDAAARGLGSLVGLFFYAVDRSHRRLAVRQLRAAFPTRSEAECRVVARATFAHFGRLLVVLLKFSTLSADQIRERVEFEGEDRVQAALARGHGAIIFTGHFGYWELQGLAQPLILPSLSVLARPLDNPYLHILLEKMRMATGNRVIYRRGALRRVLRALNANECVAIDDSTSTAATPCAWTSSIGRPRRRRLATWRCGWRAAGARVRAALMAGGTSL